MSPNWQAKLEFTPITTPTGQTLHTLADARAYLLTLPESPATLHAAGALLRAAKQPNQLFRLCARIAVWKAIYGDREPVRERRSGWREKRRARRVSGA